MSNKELYGTYLTFFLSIYFNYFVNNVRVQLLYNKENNV